MIDRTHLESLAKDIQAIARSLKIPKSKLILDEIEIFLEEHQDHGYYELILSYDENDASLETMGLHCSASELSHQRICRHHDKTLDDEVGYSTIYSKTPTIDLDLQKRRRDYILGKTD